MRWIWKQQTFAALLHALDPRCKHCGARYSAHLRLTHFGATEHTHYFEVRCFDGRLVGGRENLHHGAMRRESHAFYREKYFEARANHVARLLSLLRRSERRFTKRR